MTLGERQRRFTKYVGQLITWCYTNGLELTFGEAYRDPRMQEIYLKEGKSQIRNSLHSIRVAIDLNLFKNGVYMTKSEDYAALGKYWKSLDPENVWGGDWAVPKDGNHFQYGR